MIPERNTLNTIRSLLHHPKAARTELLAFQNRQLTRLIHHAYENVSYYRRLFDRNGLKPNDIRTLGDLSAIPVTSKKDLQCLSPEEIVAQGVNHRNLIARRTSGSSGEPFTIRRTWLEERIFDLLRLRAMRYLGQKPTDRVARIALIHTKQSREYLLPMKLLKTVGFYRTRLIDRLLSPEQILGKLGEFRPEIMMGSPVILSRLAEVINEEDRSVIRPRFLRASGEVLTEVMRRRISEAFQAPVFEAYTNREFGLVAWECKETGELHISEDSVIVEVLKDGHPTAEGEWGEFVGTNLHSFAMPLIRYRPGDLVTRTLKSCPCGQSFSTIRAIQGRILDYFLLPDGRCVHPYEIILVILYSTGSWIRQYQLTQERMDRIVLKVVPSTTPTSQELALLEESASTILGRGVEFSIILVPEIELEPSGRFIVSRSLVKSVYKGIDWDQKRTDV